MTDEDEEDDKEDDDGAGFEAEGLRDLRKRGKTFADGWFARRC